MNKKEKAKEIKKRASGNLSKWFLSFYGKYRRHSEGRERRHVRNEGGRDASPWPQAKARSGEKLFFELCHKLRQLWPALKNLSSTVSCSVYNETSVLAA